MRRSKRAQIPKLEPGAYVEYQQQIEEQNRVEDQIEEQNEVEEQTEQEQSGIVEQDDDEEEEQYGVELQQEGKGTVGCFINYLFMKMSTMAHFTRKEKSIENSNIHLE